MAHQRQNKGYEKPFFQPLNNQNCWWSCMSSVQEKMNVARRARTKKN